MHSSLHFPFTRPVTAVIQHGKGKAPIPFFFMKPIISIIPPDCYSLRIFFSNHHPLFLSLTHLFTCTVLYSRPRLFREPYLYWVKHLKGTASRLRASSLCTQHLHQPANFAYSTGPDSLRVTVTYTGPWRNTVSTLSPNDVQYPYVHVYTFDCIAKGTRVFQEPSLLRA